MATTRALLGLALAVAMQLGCRHAPATSSRPFIADAQFLDFDSGATITVVIPLLRSGGHVLPSVKQTAANDLEVHAGDDFLGYEKDQYVVRPRAGGGVEVRFRRAGVWTSGKSQRVRAPKLALFGDAARHNYVRMVYLIRVSAADHDLALLFADDKQSLDEATRLVIHEARCESTASATCRWVPPGVAVTRD